MITVNVKVGRVIEVRFASVLTYDEMRAMRSDLGAAFAKQAGQVLFAVDFQTCEPMSDEVLPMMLGLMRSDNPRILRSAHFFKPDSAVLGQMRTSIAEASNPNRQAFTDLVALSTWLKNVATAEELRQAQSFLTET